MDSLQLFQVGEQPVFAKIGECVYQKSINFEVAECLFPVYLPNVFSPNNDGINDFFYPQGNHLVYIEMTIFDCWGSLVFADESTAPAWDGRWHSRPVLEGIYVWWLRYRNALTGVVFEGSGEVLVIF